MTPPDNIVTDWKGNQIKEGDEVCFIRVKTGGYFRNAAFLIPDGKGGHTEHKIPDDPEEDCWIIEECIKIDKGLTYTVSTGSYTITQHINMLKWYIMLKSGIMKKLRQMNNKTKAPFCRGFWHYVIN